MKQCGKGTRGAWDSIGAGLDALPLTNPTPQQVAVEALIQQMRHTSAITAAAAAAEATATAGVGTSATAEGTGGAASHVDVSRFEAQYRGREPEFAPDGAKGADWAYVPCVPPYCWHRCAPRPAPEGLHARVEQVTRKRSLLTRR